MVGVGLCGGVVRFDGVCGFWLDWEVWAILNVGFGFPTCKSHTVAINYFQVPTKRTVITSRSGQGLLVLWGDVVVVKWLEFDLKVSEWKLVSWVKLYWLYFVFVYSHQLLNWCALQYCDTLINSEHRVWQQAEYYIICLSYMSVSCQSAYSYGYKIRLCLLNINYWSH